MSSTIEIRKQIKTKTISEQFIDSYKSFLEDKFENSPNYYEVNVNMNYSNDYKCLITEYDTSKNLVGYKKIIQYPYDTPVFKVGDYINWNYDNNLTNWLIFSVDKQFDYNIVGKIKRCNNTLKYLDENGVIISYPCVIDDKINNSDLDQNKHLIIPEGGIIVYLQQNSTTQDIGINYRFIFGKQAFKVNALINYSSPYFLTLIMQKDNIADGDDLVNQIADNNAYNYVLTINQNNFTQNVGYTTTLTSTIELNNEIVTKNVVWSSSNTSKVTVNSSGVVNLIGTGSAIITCAMEDNEDIYDTITITVNAILPVTEQIIISPDNYTIKQGQSQTYTVYAYIDNIVQSHKFTITASGISNPNTYYSLTTTDNSFTITNRKAYTSNDLVITCVNQTTSSVKVYNIKLMGLW